MIQQRKNVGAHLDRFISHKNNYTKSSKSTKIYGYEEDQEEPFVPLDSLPEEIPTENCFSPVEAIKFDTEKSENSLEEEPRREEVKPELANTGSDLVNFASLHYTANKEKVTDTQQSNKDSTYKKVLKPEEYYTTKEANENIKLSKSNRSKVDRNSIKDARELLNNCNSYFQRESKVARQKTVLDESSVINHKEHVLTKVEVVGRFESKLKENLKSLGMDIERGRESQKKSVASNACYKIQCAYRRHLLKKHLHSLSEIRKKEELFQRYMNHCATLIKQQYKRYSMRTKIKDMCMTIIHLQNSQDKAWRDVSERPIKKLGNNNYNIEEAIALDKLKGQSTINRKPPEKKQFLKRKDVYNPKKFIKKTSVILEESKTQTLALAELEPLEQVEEDQLESEVKENVNENEEAKPRKEFLKRKSKKVSPKKIQWKAARRTDCWNARSKSSKQKVIKARKQSQSKKQESRAVSKKALNKSMTSRSKTQTIDMPLTVNELNKIYLECHGDNQCIS
jgi:hypothetical protein